MSDKNIYQILNKSKIDIPIDTIDVSNDEINRYKKIFLNNKSNKKEKTKLFPILIAASFIIFTLFFTKPGSHVLASFSNIYKQLFNPISYEAINPELINSSITEFNKSITVNGIKVTLKEALLDDQDLFLNFIYEIDDSHLDDYQDMEIPIPTSSFGIRLDGKDYVGNNSNLSEFGGTQEGTLPKIGSSQQYFKYILNKDTPIKDINNFSLVFNEFFVLDYASALEALKNGKGLEDVSVKYLEGEGQIDFSIKDSTNSLHTKEKILNKKIGSVDNLPIIIEKVRINPLSMKIVMTRQLDIDEYSLQGSSQRQAFTNGIYFKLIDESGKEYIIDDFIIIKDYYTFTLNEIEDSLLKSNSITLIPFVSQEVKNNMNPASYEFIEEEIDIKFD